MYLSPTKADLDRNLSRIFHDARKQAEAQRAGITSQCVARGLSLSSVLIGMVVQAVDKIHERAIGEAMNFLKDFVERSRTKPAEAAECARPHLRNMANTLIAEIPAAGFPQQQQRMRNQYTQVFEQRLDGALHDFMVGFIGGRSIMTEPEKSQTVALRMLKEIYDQTRHGGSPIFVATLEPTSDPRELEAQGAWRYLRDSGLIETFNLPYSARINAAGIDAIENARKHPDTPVQPFPSVTYNISIGTAINSPVQQAGAGSTQSQVISYNGDQRAELERLVGELTSHFGELKLDADSEKKARAQLATLQAQLTAEPDPIIVRQAGKSLRNITEGVIAGLITAGVQPTVWPWVMETLHRLF